MIILGIETSCDETAVGIVSEDRRILANRIASQAATHQAYGGVVPEIAARAHLQHLDHVVLGALDDAGLGWSDIGGIAATCGPGLIGGVMVGAMFGKAVAAARKLPFAAVNHLEAHALTARLTDDVPFPYVLLLVSGGHCQLLLVRGVGDYRLLGGTIDDAAGECFDKAAKLLGLPYPGGPAIAALAEQGDPRRFALPRPLMDQDNCDFSFSGLKTAVRRLVEREDKPEGTNFRADVAASLQETIAHILAGKTARALALAAHEKPTTLVAAGGVAANKVLRLALAKTAAQSSLPLVVPPPALCTDNGVMIAWTGVERLRLGLSDGFDAPARPRWPLAELVKVAKTSA
ncbi:MAG: tRNA (adenosine(37)-N6)-threonylcarbamoyltransferase complex transferase subunit TsaD [Alphaproteobacteria bacterium]